MKTMFSVLVGIFLLFIAPAYATVDDSQSFAYEAAAPYVKEGYTMRNDTWGGDLGVNDRQNVRAQLFKGNDYWFILASDTKGSTLTVHIYNAEGALTENEAWHKGSSNTTKASPSPSTSNISQNTSTTTASPSTTPTPRSTPNNQEPTAGARISCKETGLYNIIVEVLSSPEERTSWGLVYGYK